MRAAELREKRKKGGPGAGTRKALTCAMSGARLRLLFSFIYFLTSAAAFLSQLLPIASLARGGGGRINRKCRHFEKGKARPGQNVASCSFISHLPLFPLSSFLPFLSLFFYLPAVVVVVVGRLGATAIFIHFYLREWKEARGKADVEARPCERQLRRPMRTGVGGAFAVVTPLHTADWLGREWGRGHPRPEVHRGAGFIEGSL